jgi:hypothetical protein
MRAVFDDGCIFSDESSYTIETDIPVRTSGLPFKIDWTLSLDFSWITGKRIVEEHTAPSVSWTFPSWPML